MTIGNTLSFLMLLATTVVGFQFVALTNGASSRSGTRIPAYLDDQEPLQIMLGTTLTDVRIRKLFAWIKCAFGSNGNGLYADYYNNIELAIASAFGENLPESSLPTKLMDLALEKEDVNSKEWEETLVGDSIGRRERESSSLGAMGAGQWTGQFMTRPHSLLDISNFTSVDEWIGTLPRGCRRTMKKATPELQNFTVTPRPIRGGDPAPHSSFQHFRCVVHHEVRLLSNLYGGQSTQVFFSALAEAISRFLGTTRQAGNILEYRDTETGRVIGFAHEIGKARTFRGQWFYCDDDAAKRYVWFHSVKDLVERAIADERIDTVDLGPSGTGSSAELKERYGFASVVDWPALADYTSGGFIYEPDQNDKEELGNEMMSMIEKLFERQASRERRRTDE